MHHPFKKYLFIFFLAMAILFTPTAGIDAQTAGGSSFFSFSSLVNTLQESISSFAAQVADILEKQVVKDRN